METLEIWASWSAIVQAIVSILAILLTIFASLFAIFYWKKQKLYGYLEDLQCLLFCIDCFFKSNTYSTFDDFNKFIDDFDDMSKEYTCLNIRINMLSNSMKWNREKYSELSEEVTEVLFEVRKFRDLLDEKFMDTFEKISESYDELDFDMIAWKSSYGNKDLYKANLMKKIVSLSRYLDKQFKIPFLKR